MKVYIAAPWADRDLAREYGRRFTESGHTITEPWWNHKDVNGDDNASEELLAQAKKDVVGVYACDLFVLINSRKSEGKAVEQGFALAWEKPIIAIGTRGEHSANVFHYLPRYKWVTTIEEALEVLG